MWVSHSHMRTHVLELDLLVERADSLAGNPVRLRIVVEVFVWGFSGLHNRDDILLDSLD
jgi:hypothetical protein